MGISPAVYRTILPRWKLGAFLLMVLWALAFPMITSMPAQAGDYRLNSGDVLTFDFLDDAELPVTATVSGAGVAQFPLIGGVEVIGLTVPEALAKLRSEYRRRDVLVDPKISLDISTFRPIFVLGEVKTPGSFPF